MSGILRFPLKVVNTHQGFGPRVLKLKITLGFDLFSKNNLLQSSYIYREFQDNMIEEWSKQKAKQVFWIYEITAFLSCLFYIQIPKATLQQLNKA